MQTPEIILSNQPNDQLLDPEIVASVMETSASGDGLTAYHHRQLQKLRAHRGRFLELCPDFQRLRAWERLLVRLLASESDSRASQDARTRYLQEIQPSPAIETLLPNAPTQQTPSETHRSRRMPPMTLRNSKRQTVPHTVTTGGRQAAEFDGDRCLVDHLKAMSPEKLRTFLLRNPDAFHQLLPVDKPASEFA